MSATTHDAVVVGAGTSGVNAALQLARRGRRVALVEQRRAGTGGARWRNGVLAWQFERAGLTPPVAPEARSFGGRTHMVGPDGTTFVVQQSPTIDADMRLLNERLLSEAMELGVDMVDRAATVHATSKSGRLVRIDLTRTTTEEGSAQPGPRIGLTAPLFVDASGGSAVLRRQVPDLDRWCPQVQAHDLCSAAQYTFHVADAAGAEAFLASHGARAGESVTRVGFAGGFSALAVHIDADLSEVGVLTGTLGDGRWGSGTSILELTRAQNRWIGEPLFGGSGLIPLRRPYDRLTSPGLALVGDSAAQMFPAHGSGIGIGLIASSMLAEAVGDDSDPGSTDALWRYQSNFMREFGGTLAAYDAVRRMSTAVGTSGIASFFRSGMVDESTTSRGLDQRWEPIPAGEAVRQLPLLAARPASAARAVPWLLRAAIAPTLYQRYPARPDLGQLVRWAARTRRVLGGAS